METALELPLVKDLKQIKVDNWGTFFLQRLLHLYLNEELLDFHIRFQKNNHVVKVHRLVVTACTDYFLELERQQCGSNAVQDKSIIMPPDITYESVKSIISFMYTGQLEYWASEHQDLYRTAKKLKMSVLIKLLDAQSDQVRVASITEPENDAASDKRFIFQRRKSFDENISDKVSPVIKRKREHQQPLLIPKSTVDLWNSEAHNNFNTSSLKNYGGPSRFDLPEVDELTLGVFSSFDDITYNTQPIIQAPERTSYSNKIFSTFLSVPSNPESANTLSFSRVNDVTSENSDDDWSQSYLTKMSEVQHISKKVRFDSSNKENLKKLDHHIDKTDTSVEVIDNHAKIIREVLKKYPHLVQHSKNIRLKIMQKETNHNECSTPFKTKISYVVLKSDFLVTSSDDMNAANYSTLDNNETGPWKCVKCNLDEEYTDYFMYRRHMQDVHNEKFDPRVCEHCGYKATKRNILMYHMYTKHNVTPPKNMSFPRCKICSYVGLSESLLARHQANHKNQCINFSPTLLTELHAKRTLHSEQSRKKDIDTDIGYREKEDNETNDLSNLKFHLESSHRNTLSDSTSKMETDYKLSSIQTPSVKMDVQCQTKLENTSQNAINAFIVEHSEVSRRPDSIIYYNTDTQTKQKDLYINNECYVSNKNILKNFGNFGEHDEIVTEVVEEFHERAENETDKGICEIPNISSINCKRKNSTDYVEINSDVKKLTIDNVENTIQYVEEETEIVEYETNCI